jgi:hypothetical protein
MRLCRYVYSREIVFMRKVQVTGLLAALILSTVAHVEADDDTAQTLKYGDGAADGKQSFGGSGQLMEFTLPEGKSKIAGLRIHGSRYGSPEAPDEKFLIYFLNANRDRVVATEMAPYSLFERGGEKWVTILFAEPVEMHSQFWVATDFRANQRKGVYVSYDTSTKGEHSRVGLPGTPATETKFAGDWMIEVVMAE